MNDLIRAEIMAQAAREVWAILPVALTALFNGGLARDRAEELLAESIVEASSTVDVAAVVRSGPKSGRVVRVPIVGAITRRDSFWSLFFGGGATVERITKTLREVG